MSKDLMFTAKLMTGFRDGFIVQICDDYGPLEQLNLKQAKHLHEDLTRALIEAAKL